MFGMALLVIGIALEQTLIPLRAIQEGMTASLIGPLMSAYYVGFATGCLWVPRIVQRTGHIRSFATFASVAAAAALGFAIYADPALWGVLRALTGFCFAGLSMVSESWLNERAENANRGRLLSFYRVVDLGAFTAGQFLLQVAPVGDFLLFAVVAVALSLAVVPLTMSASREPQPLPATKLRIGAVFEEAPVAVIGCLAIGLANGAFWSLGPVFANLRGGGSDFVATFMALSVIGGALTAFPAGFLSDRVDRRLVIAICLFLTMLIGIALAFAGAYLGAALLPLVFLFGGAMLPVYSLCVAHANDRMSSGQYVLVSRALLLVFGAGASIGPSLAALLMDWLAPEVLFGYCALIYGAAGLFTAYRMLRRQPAVASEVMVFASVPGLSTGIAEAARSAHEEGEILAPK
jgi:MFS family permease